MSATTIEKVWTYQDLLQLPDDGKRYEIIDGELIEMTAPNMDHASSVSNLFALLIPVVRSIGARIYTAPLDVLLPDGAVVQPDLVVILAANLHRRAKHGLVGIPDLAIEILSPSNPAHDRIRKRRVYAANGVPEYWLVSPEAALIEVLVLRGDAYHTLVRAAGDEPIRSDVLPQLAFPVSAVFADEIAG